MRSVALTIHRAPTYTSPRGLKPAARHTLTDNALTCSRVGIVGKNVVGQEPVDEFRDALVANRRPVLIVGVIGLRAADGGVSKGPRYADKWDGFTPAPVADDRLSGIDVL